MPSCGACPDGSSIAITSTEPNCPLCTCLPTSTAVPPPGSSCPTPSCGDCQPPKTATLTMIGTKCPSCTCVVPSNTSAPVSCPTPSCAGCATGSTVAITTPAGKCPKCTCLPTGTGTALRSTTTPPPLSDVDEDADAEDVENLGQTGGTLENGLRHARPTEMFHDVLPAPSSLAHNALPDRPMHSQALELSVLNHALAALVRPSPRLEAGVHSAPAPHPLPASVHLPSQPRARPLPAQGALLVPSQG
ncbi:hypothetical protein CC1G_04889 [Coprinopsis cinerea okayama7|uniref:Uncharacterized protein n=1 Tax=Coprinopsis cinerea (strain Okayama-7 / 130 / ATCC MYA-4618 / FGSC 9003) TaxID=240176 RepID=A8PFY1_COPC7|nr:hypothetical protein CC1G_04889 [Coprinopsis cinerea okayama7\|eukprot:XP_001841045.2 hypothetical protein CC1G_04889 [Coprinopsis cinerea okayama7\